MKSAHQQKMNQDQLIFKKISTKNTLCEVSNFLEDGFDWPKNNTKLIQDELPKINNRLGYYGVTMNANKKIVGAILFFHQGYFKIKNNEIPIINMSSWCVAKDFRGLPTISLTRFMMDELKDSIITNYSANEAATKILIAAGFKRMKLKRTSLLFYQVVFKYFKNKIGIENVSKNCIKLTDNLACNLDKGNGINYLNININQNQVQLILKEKFFQRSLLGISFKMKTSIIIWSSDDQIISNNWEVVAQKIIIFTRSMKLICDFEYSSFPEKYIENENNYLIFSNYDSCVSMKPIQSELNIFK
jgi:hypothetical protein